MTRHDAERQLQKWGLEPEWHWDEDEEIPPPPLDRIALAREVLTTIKFPLNDRQTSVAGCEWRLLSGDADSLIESSWRVRSKPENREELFEIVAEIYQHRWYRAWSYGGSPDWKKTFRDDCLEAAVWLTSNEQFEFTDSDLISYLFSKHQARNFAKMLDWVGYEGRSLLVANGTRNSGLVGVALALSLLVFLVLLGLWCLQKLSLWQMLGVCLFIALIYNRFEASQRTWRWIEPELTFGELGERLHRRAWEDYEEMMAFAQSMSADDR